MGANLILPAGSAAAADDSDPVARSLRLDGTSRLQRSISSAGNRLKWTWAGWVKRAGLGATQSIWMAGGSSTNYTQFLFDSDDTLKFDNKVSGGNQGRKHSLAKFRDGGAWMHVTLIWDAANSTQSNRIRIYINGAEVAAWATNENPGTDNQTSINNAETHMIGRNTIASVQNLKAQLADIYFIDGAAVTPVNNFIEDNDYGGYKPKAYDMSSHAGHSFHLTFEDSSNIGEDDANSNDFTVADVGSHDVMLDTPTKNYAVLNPLDPAGSDNTFSEGNLKCVVSAQNTSEESTATIGISSGKWYWEQYVVSTTSSDGGYLKVGVKSDTGSKYWHVRGSDGETESDTGSGASNGSSSVSYDTTNIVGVAVDMDAGKWWVSVDGTFVGSPTAGTGELHSGLSGTVLPYVLNASTGGSHTIVCNFGQDPTFAGNKTSGQDTSQSEFYDAPPSGFKALCSANFDDPTVRAHENFGVATYTGNDTDNTSITGLDFQPDFTWIKQRTSSSTSHFLHDSMRTQGSPTSLWNYLKSNSNNAESWDSDQFDGFLSDGFKISSNGNSDDINKSSRAYVAWNWKKNVSAGFDIVTWTGDSSSTGSGYSEQSVSHSLGVAPEMILAKNRTDNGISNDYGNTNWAVYHKDLTSNYFLKLNSTDAQGNHDGSLFSGVGASSVSFGNDGNTYHYLNYDGLYYSADTYVAYLFASVDGVTKVGSYTGNASSDGPFVYCGFRPAFLFIKNANASADWKVLDNARDVKGNVVQKRLAANNSNAEDSLETVDFLSNGFKIRRSAAAENGSGNKIIYLAMAEQPFKTSNAR